MNDPSCLFCKIAARQIPAKIVHEDDSVVAFEDIHPQAPVHLLVIPRKHLVSLADSTPEDSPLLGQMLTVAAELARKHHLDKGYRTIINNGALAGQSVYHLHVHVMGGRGFQWPPG